MEANVGEAVDAPNDVGAVRLEGHNGRMAIGFGGARCEWPVGPRTRRAKPVIAPAIGMEARRAETRLAKARYGARQPGRALGCGFWLGSATDRHHGIFAALAEFIRERTVMGLKAARARGRKGDRKFALSKAQVRLAQAEMASGDTSVADLCWELGIGRMILYRYVDPKGRLREHGRRSLEG